ncbi:11426_t:CDS:2, partial [Gigaspora margarita]
DSEKFELNNDHANLDSLKTLLLSQSEVLKGIHLPLAKMEGWFISFEKVLISYDMNVHMSAFHVSAGMKAYNEWNLNEITRTLFGKMWNSIDSTPKFDK